jgi:pimeloyl-ACP methyl ester carboxylesterase
MPFRSSSLALPGGACPCHEAGTGDPVLYIHGAGGLRLSPGLERLAERRRVIAPVLPGFDGTPRREGLRTVTELADFAAAAIDASVGQPCDVIGHSFGAGVAAWLALRHPAKLQLLVLAGMSPAGVGPLPSDPARLRALTFAHPENLPLNDKSETVVSENFAAAQYYRGDGAAARELPDRLGDISALTLILHGTKDGIVPTAAPRLLKERIQRSHLVYVYDAAHGIDWDQPARFAVLVGDFLARGEAFIVHRSETEAAD